MAFFGITNLGYQNPIGNKMLVNPKASDFQVPYRLKDCDPKTSFHTENAADLRGLSKQSRLPPVNVPNEPLKCTDTCSVYNQPPPCSRDIHHGSYERYLEMRRRAQTPRAPNQLYLMPLTDSQQYGWLLLNKKQESWTKVKRFPHRNSEMTKFVEDMSMTDREFSLF
ncbi:sperm microtubule inner protein 11 [Aplochiton taeniatus]